MGEATLIYTAADGVTMALNDGVNVLAVNLGGLGVAPSSHQMEVVSLQDGERYQRTLLGPRFIALDLIVLDTSWAAAHTRRRTLIAALNPRKGLGKLRWTPVDGGASYDIDAIMAGGFGLPESQELGMFAVRDSLSFHCPDPAWRSTTETTTNFGVAASGLAVPVDVPAELTDGSVTNAINNTGDLDTYPTVTFPGPCLGPRIENLTTGKVCAFPALALLSGETLTIDAKAKTALVGAVNVLGSRRPSDEFWPLTPGNNSVKASTSSGASAAAVKHFVRYAGV